MIAVGAAADLQRSGVEVLAEDIDTAGVVVVRIGVAVADTAAVGAEATTQDSSEPMALAVGIVDALTMLAVGIADERMLG
jgi:hypothetical protein